MPVVVDANVAIKWIVQEDELNDRALAIRDSGEWIAAPDLILTEVLNIAWKKWRRGEMTPEETTEGFIGILNFIDIVPAMSLYPRALTLAFDLDHPVYDCFYLACAEATESILVTADRRLHGATVRGGLSHLVRHLADFPP